MPEFPLEVLYYIITFYPYHEKTLLNLRATCTHLKQEVDSYIGCILQVYPIEKKLVLVFPGMKGIPIRSKDLCNVKSSNSRNQFKKNWFEALEYVKHKLCSLNNNNSPICDEQQQQPIPIWHLACPQNVGLDFWLARVNVINFTIDNTPNASFEYQKRYAYLLHVVLKYFEMLKNFYNIINCSKFYLHLDGMRLIWPITRWIIHRINECPLQFIVNLNLNLSLSPNSNTDRRNKAKLGGKYKFLQFKTVGTGRIPFGGFELEDGCKLELLSIQGTRNHINCIDLSNVVNFTNRCKTLQKLILSTMDITVAAPTIVDTFEDIPSIHSLEISNCKFCSVNDQMLVHCFFQTIQLRNTILPQSFQFPVVKDLTLIGCLRYYQNSQFLSPFIGQLTTLNLILDPDPMISQASVSFELLSIVRTKAFAASPIKHMSISIPGFNWTLASRILQLRHLETLFIQFITPTNELIPKVAINQFLDSLAINCKKLTHLTITNFNVQSGKEATIAMHTAGDVE